MVRRKRGISSREAAGSNRKRPEGRLRAGTSIFVAAFFACVTVLHAQPLDKTVMLGKTAMWQSISSFDGVALRQAASGDLVLSLASAAYAPDATTDLLLHFDSTPYSDASGNYRLQDSQERVTHRWAQIGTGAAVFDSDTSTLTVTPRTSAALFGPGREWRAFSIEFWLYTPDVGGGQTVFLWHGARKVGNAILPQEIRCSLERGTLRWELTNFFTPPDGAAFSMTLKYPERIIPREWHHYTLRFDDQTGMVESLIDGVPQAIEYANNSGRENGTVFLPTIGRASGSVLQIGSHFVGFIDELRISSAFVKTPVTHRYRMTPGSAITRPIDLGYTDSNITSITAEDTTPADTGVFYFYRTANEKSASDTLSGTWVQFAPGHPLPNTAKGRYLQLKLELLPNGTGEQTPTVSDVSFSFTPRLPPPAPAFLTATPGDGSITLTWRKVVSADLKGYRVYYGRRPQQYFGTGSTAGPSPIDVGNVTSFTVAGLENGQLYYFAVVAYDSSQPPHLSPFSNEVAARPSKLAGTSQ